MTLQETRPESLERDGPAGLVIGWSDGARRRYTAAALRAACPCATCREKKSADTTKSPAGGKTTMALLPVLSLQEARPTAIEHMRPVGNYAYNIAFSDGHDSGIFTFDYLLGLGESIET